ncbi:hypothetical protein CDAR_462161 [Caerostris darwini]|uniref:Uncharacterized protein n=1 Tax=Caerostris darwini TaxID=1538125 RepID=A0AAV4R7S2_9ARAC|nr:hypothetical protein CDAR_462161 [Caerostris darwini]
MEVDVRNDCSSTGNSSHEGLPKVPAQGIHLSAVPMYLDETDICQQITLAEQHLNSLETVTQLGGGPAYSSPIAPSLLVSESNGRSKPKPY